MEGEVEEIDEAEEKKQKELLNSVFKEEDGEEEEGVEKDWLLKEDAKLEKIEGKLEFEENKD